MMLKIIFSAFALFLILLFGKYKDWLPSDTVTIGLLFAALAPWGAAFIQSAKLPGGFELIFRDLEQKVKEQDRKIEEQQLSIDSLNVARKQLEIDYLAACDRFDLNAQAIELNDLCTDLKSLAGGLYNLEFLRDQIQAGSPQGHVLGVACAIQVRPQHEFLMPIANFISSVSQDENLRSIRLKVLYRLVIAIENIIRVDGKRSMPLLNSQDKEEVRKSLELLAEHHYAVQDHQRSARQSLITRINRILVKIKALN
jgi:hypothetical protein